MARLALHENLLSRGGILSIPRGSREQSGSKHNNENSHPNVSTLDNN